MAIKSNNTQGNPYYDESTGRFTSENSGGSANNSVEDVAKGIDGKHLAIKIKLTPGALRNNFQQILQEQPTQTPQTPQQPGQYRPATTVEEAIQVGKSIVPDCLINYSSNCDIEKLNETNKGLSDVVNRYPGFTQNGLLNAFGDGISLSLNDIKEQVISSAVNVLQKDTYFKGVYDDFFAKSSQRYGLSEEDKYSSEVLSHFMGWDSGFSASEYVNSANGGDTLAYYQVSQDNIFNPSAGGKGINGAVKFYNSMLQKATSGEIALNKSLVDQGFHFDYGDHSYTYGTAVHELGHSIFTIAFKKCTDEERNELVQLLNEGARGKDYNQVSGYGHRTLYEQEAESVADVFCRGENATPHNKKMVAWLDKVHNRLKQAGEI